MSCLTAGITGWTSGHKGSAWLTYNTDSRGVWLPTQMKKYQYRGTLGKGHQLIHQQEKKRMPVCFLETFDSEVTYWKRTILTSWVLLFPFLSKKVSSAELFWGYLCVKAMSTHWPWPIHHSRNTRRRVFAWQDKYLSTNTAATEAKTAIAWSCNSSYWAADQSWNPGFWFGFT